MAYKIAHLQKEQARLIERLEEELGVCAIALEPGLEMAELTEAELKKVKDLEERIGARLIVYKEC